MCAKTMSDKLFKFCFGVTLLLIIIFFIDFPKVFVFHSRPIKSLSIRDSQMIHENVDLRKIKKYIQEGMLSEHEALFYKQVNE
jgi:hypothetical protein